MEKIKHEQYRKGLADDLRDLRSKVTGKKGKEKAGFFLNVNKDTERYNLAKFEHRKEFSESKEEEEKVQIESKEEKLNQFGLPINWAHEKSLEGLAYIREKLKGQHVNLDKVFKNFFHITSQEYRKYRPQVSPIHFSGFSSLEASQHLKMNSDEKLVYFKNKWPKGLGIINVFNPGKYMKWEEILDYELWSIANHGQTLDRLNQRGGLSPIEIISAISSVSCSSFENSKQNMENIMNLFKEQDMLMK